VVLAVAHSDFLALESATLKAWRSNGKGQGIVIDVKSVLSRRDIEAAALIY
jgi:hypothetical protein